MRFEMSGGRFRLLGAALVVGVVAASLVVLPVAGVDPVGAEGESADPAAPWTFQQVSLGGRLDTVSGAVSLSDGGESVALGGVTYCAARTPLDAGDRPDSMLVVADSDLSAGSNGDVTWHGADYFQVPDCDEPRFGLAGDGLTLVSSVKSSADTSVACPEPAPPAVGGANYDVSQIVVWDRATRSDDFGAPRLISRVGGGCDGQWAGWTNGEDPTTIKNLIGAGGYGSSFDPSISADGSVVVFRSWARDLGVAPTAAGTPGLFISSTVVPDPVVNGDVELITPADFEGQIYDPQVNGDATSVVFRAKGNLTETAPLVASTTEADGWQIWVARAPVSGVWSDMWTLELVSKDHTGAVMSEAAGVEPNASPTISTDGNRVAFTTGSTDFEQLATYPAGTNEFLALRDFTLGVNRVLVGPNDPTGAYPTSATLGVPAFNDDGSRVAISAGHLPVTGLFSPAFPIGILDYLRVFDLDNSFGNNVLGTPVTRPALVTSTFIENHRETIDLAGTGDQTIVAMAAGGYGVPARRYSQDPPAVYVGAPGGIADDALLPFHGDPVNAATGAFRQSDVDLQSLGGAGLSALTREYSSTGDGVGIFGRGWMTPLDVNLNLFSETGTVTVSLGVDRRVVYAPDGNSWVTSSGYLGVLTRDVGAGTWSLLEPSGLRRDFDGEGRLSAMSAPGQPTTTLTWDNSQDEDDPIWTPLVVTGGDVTLTFVDDGPEEEGYSEPDGFIDRVESSEGIQVTYAFTQDGGANLLTSASKPHVPGQDPDTVGQRGYEYQTGTTLLTRITDQVDATRTHQVVENTYDDYGLVAAQVTDTGDIVTFEYGMKPAPPAGMVAADGFTTVTDTASGDVTVYQYGTGGEVLAITDALGNSVGRGWEGDQPGSSTSRSGVASTYTYDAANRVETVSQTVGGATHVTSTLTYKTAATDPAAISDRRVATSTDASGVTITFTYEGASRQPKTVAVPCDPSSLGSGLSCPGNGLSTTTYTYGTGNLDGLVVEAIDPDGVKTTTGYHPDRSLASTTIYEDDATPRTTLMAELVPGDAGWPFTDPLIARATRTETPGGDVSWSGVDAQGLVRESRDPLYDGGAHKATRTAYRLDGTVESVTDPSDHVTTFDVRRREESNESSEFESWEPDGLDSAIAEVRINTDADGVSSVSKVDSSGDTVETMRGDAADKPGMSKTLNTYGELGRLISTVGPDGVTTTNHYDVEGRVTGVTVGSDPNSAVNTTTTVYNAFGEVESTSTPMGTDPDTNTVTRKTDYFYDAAGRKVAQLEGATGPAAEQLLMGYEYDGAGRLFRTIEHRHDYLDTANPTVHHIEDVVSETRLTIGGRTTQQVGPPVDAVTFDWSQPDTAKSITTSGYDDAGRQVTTTDPAGKTTTTTYDPDSRVASVETPGGKVATYGYDSAGQQTTITGPSGMTGSGDPATVTTVTGYDPSGRVVTETDPHVPQSGLTDPSTRFTEYTPAGLVNKVTDANGDIVTYLHDERGNRLSRTAKDDGGNDVVESWGFDLADRETSHTMPSPKAGLGPQTTVSTYDGEFGRLATVTDPTSRVQTRAYYSDGTLKSQTWTRGTSQAEVDSFWVNHRGWRIKSSNARGASSLEFTTLFDRAGQRVADTTHTGDTITRGFALSGARLTLGYPDGASSAYQHDARGLLTDLTVTSGGVTVPYASYIYDDDGQQTNELLHAAGGATRVNTYTGAGQLDTITEVMRRPNDTWETYTASLTYRADGRIDTETVNTDPTITYDYDDAGQIVSAVDGVDDYGYTYGTRGNRLTTSHNTDTTTYQTNTNGSVAKTTTGADTTKYYYDEAGRLGISIDQTSGATTGYWSNGYNTRGLSTAIQTTRTGSPTVSEYRSYDADGLMILADILSDGPTKTWHYQWDTDQAIPQVVDTRAQGALWLRATWGNQRIGFNTGTADPLWFQYDAHGSAIRNEPSNTDIYNGPETYDPNGNSDATDYVRIGYRSEFTSGNLLYLRNRNYNPNTGQFTTQDPLDGVNGTPTVANPYHYVENDTLNRVDPMGLRGERALCAPSPVSYGDKAPLVVRQPVQRERLRGAVRIGLYIPTESSGIPNIDALRSHGDDRGPCAVADLSQYRAVATVDFESGMAEFRINPSCGTGGPPNDCHAPLPVVDSFATIDRWYQRIPVFVDDSNRVKISAGPAQSVKIRFAILNSDKRLVAPAIDGSFEVKRRGQRDVCLDYHRDSYPALEAYQYRDGRTLDLLAETAAHNSDRGLLPLPFTDKDGSTCQ